MHPEQEWTWSGSLELDAAIRLADLNAAANKLMRAKEALKRLEAQGGVLTVVRARRSLPEHLVLFVYHKPGLLEMLDLPSSQHLAGIIGHMLHTDPTQQATTARDRKAIEKASWSRTEW